MSKANENEIVPIPTSAVASRSRKKLKPAEFKAPAAAADPQAQLEAQANAISESKSKLGYNVGLQLVEAGQRGFADGLTTALKEGVESDASFFSHCVRAAGLSLI